MPLRDLEPRVTQRLSFVDAWCESATAPHAEDQRRLRRLAGPTGRLVDQAHEDHGTTPYERTGGHQVDSNSARLRQVSLVIRKKRRPEFHPAVGHPRYAPQRGTQSTTATGQPAGVIDTLIDEPSSKLIPEPVNELPTLILPQTLA